jgi:hypothetical protein
MPVTIRLKFFRSFLVVGILVNMAAMFFFKPLVSYLVALLTLGFVAASIRCTRCGKSPYIKVRGEMRIGSPIPERICSRCGKNFMTDL